MKKNKKISLTILVVLLSFFATLLLAKDRFFSPSVPASTSPQPHSAKSTNFILPNYPQSSVPLYQVDKIDSFKYFVNYSRSTNYYNIVYSTTASPTQIFDYYRSLMSPVDQSATNDTQIEGLIGDYKVSVSHYGEDTDDVYIQVYLPQYSQDNPYYTDYPQNLVDFQSEWSEQETSYGLLNQKGGEIEYTRYFSIDVQKLDSWIEQYKTLYSAKQNFNFNPESGIMTWTDDQYQITLTFSQDHGRVYLMLRKPMLF